MRSLTAAARASRSRSLGAAGQRGPDGRQQDLVVERLLDEIDGARLHGLDGERHVAVARHDDHRQGGLDLARDGAAAPGRPFRGMRTSVTTQPSSTSGRTFRKATAEFVDAHGKAGGAQQEGQRLPDVDVVVDDMNHADQPACSASSIIGGCAM